MDGTNSRPPFTYDPPGLGTSIGAIKGSESENSIMRKNEPVFRNLGETLRSWTGLKGIFKLFVELLSPKTACTNRDFRDLAEQGSGCF